MCDCHFCRQSTDEREAEVEAAYDATIWFCDVCKLHYVDNCPSCEARADAYFDRMKDGEL